ncbi:DUF1971 domain-containing protein [Sphingopyxis sp. H050]|jgi:tellurite resistance-related uncharacterized protein|uniref:DUF1971 domain-containing protein n=1 Tax=Sphingopyxis sp. H050 TaxID=1759072 RepID=UPI0009EC5FD6|nr:DUF1971 domain-containing protein [Sphingopyxis sp. H050]
MTIAIPESLQSYRRTGSFTESTIPAALLSDHSTKKGVWGLIDVAEGSIRYVVTDTRRKPYEKIITQGGEPGVVEPTILHRVEPIGPVCFHVEFLRASY